MGLRKKGGEFLSHQQLARVMGSARIWRGGEFRVPPAPPTKGSVWRGCRVLCVRVLFVVVLSWIDFGEPPAPLRSEKKSVMAIEV